VKYDYVIVGAGLFGATCAALLWDKKVLVIEKENKVGGMCSTRLEDGMLIHEHGPHIFHTDNYWAWRFVNTYEEFKQFTYQPVAYSNGEYFNLPINLMTYHRLNNKIGSPSEVSGAKEVEGMIHERFIKHYSEKQWGMPFQQIPEEIVGRLIRRDTFDCNYFNDRYQGLPINGYSSMIEKMLQKAEVKLNAEYEGEGGDQAIWTAPIEEYFYGEFGELDYRSLRFSHAKYYCKTHQGAPVVNYTGTEHYTRKIEWKHFHPAAVEHTIVTTEYPSDTGPKYYPIRTKGNVIKYEKYREEGLARNNLHFGGRLGTYKYMNMDEVILQARDLIRRIK